MRMCACMYVYVHAIICEYIYSMSVYECVYLYVCLFMRAQAHVCVRVFVCIYVRVLVCSCTYTHIYVYIYRPTI